MDAKARVWYAKDAKWMMPFSPVPPDLTDHEMVGEIDIHINANELDGPTETLLDVGFANLQNIEDNEVEKVLGKPGRSMSVGDILEISGEYWCARNIGWEQHKMLSLHHRSV